MLKQFPDHSELWAVKALRAKSYVLPLGLDVARLQAYRPQKPTTGRPLILWNHRWENYKAPHIFSQAIYALADAGLDFGLLLLGRSHRNEPDEFLETRERLSDRIVHYGYARATSTYGRRLWQADIVVSTAVHDFFGAAVVEACYCGCYPVLPHDLAYPELIPTAHHKACLYDDFQGLLERLRTAITVPELIRTFSLQDHMEQFDWRHMAPIYDVRLAEVSTASHSQKWA